MIQQSSPSGTTALSSAPEACTMRHIASSHHVDNLSPVGRPPRVERPSRVERLCRLERLSRLAGLCAALVLAAGLLVETGALAQEIVPAPAETSRQVRRALDRLPYYGVFDFLAFGLKDRVVTLQGFVQRAALKREAEVMVKKATALEVANQIEVLPVSSIDDGLRWEAYLRIYSDDFATRYVSGGGITTRFEALDMLRFPGMEPYGNYPVHIIVKHRKVLLVGVVDSDFDKQALIVRARSVPHILDLEDGVMVRPKSTR